MDNLFLNAKIEDIVRGYQEEKDHYVCLICGKTYTKGEIYVDQNHYYDARKMMQRHIEKTHQSVLNYLLTLNPDYLGVSAAQISILQGMAEGKSDKEIAENRQLSTSTVRNHRFKLREKQRQAKVFLALMELLEGNKSDKWSMIDAHPTATMLDDRYHLTDEERQNILALYMDSNGALKEIPSKEKRKIVVLKEIAKNFKNDRSYSEVEVNRILKRIHEDYPYLRRLLIEYGFLDRTRDGKNYWVK